MKTINLLILEDDVETVSLLLKHIASLEEKLSPRYEIDVTVFSNYKQVEDLVNTQPRDSYDIILLDRDCKMGGSFHALDIEDFGPERIISISSTPQWNRNAQERGVQAVVLKDFANLEKFAMHVIEKLEKLILA